MVDFFRDRPSLFSLAVDAKGFTYTVALVEGGGAKSSSSARGAPPEGTKTEKSSDKGGGSPEDVSEGHGRQNSVAVVGGGAQVLALFSNID